MIDDKDAIEKALKRDAEIDAENIKVSANGGKVTLSDQPENAIPKDRARFWGTKVHARSSRQSADHPRKAAASVLALDRRRNCDPNNCLGGGGRMPDFCCRERNL